ncbi:MAG: hypothetical protein JO001_15155 [Alphaproteobacteria bacterium]|nr:hypothetical protein [Alphaproteobacteria bacterium]
MRPGIASAWLALWAREADGAKLAGNADVVDWVMARTTIRVCLGATALLTLAACNRDIGPYPSYYYAAQPAPPPLQPYVEPVAPPPAAVVRHTYRRRYVRHRHYYHRQVRCPCLPTQPIR